jgi:diguanylate cyclase (GGDEF)-like protein
MEEHRPATEASLHIMQCAVLEAIATGEPLEAALGLLCLHAEQLASGIACSVLRVDQQGRVRPIAGPSLPDAYSRALDGILIGPEVGSCGTAAYFGEAVEVHDIETDPRWQPFKAMPLAAGLRACWSTPIWSRDGRVVGTFAFYFRTCRGPDELERQIVRAGVHLCMIAIERDEAQRRAATTAHQFSAALQSMSQGLCLYGADEKLIVYNQRFLEIYGLPPDRIRPGLSYLEMAQLVWRDDKDPEQAARRVHDERRALLDSGVSSRLVRTLPSGTTIAIAVSPTEDGGWVATYEDITDQRRAHEQIEHLAHHDALTGLPNRAMFLAELEKAIEGHRRGQAFAVLYLDLDYFKAVNDNLGHGAGDTLLQHVADRLRNCARAGDLVARLSGDEFTVLMRGLPESDTVELLAQRIVDVIGAPFRIGGHPVSIGACVGICRPEDESPNADEVLHRADLALYQAKGSGRGQFRLFEHSREQPRSEGMQLATALKLAIT